MSRENLIKMQCSACHRINYWTTKNKKTITKKLGFSKFCKWCRKHTIHKETKK